MKPTIETGNVSQQPECFGEKVKNPHKIIVEFGKYHSEKVVDDLKDAKAFFDEFKLELQKMEAKPEHIEVTVLNSRDNVVFYDVLTRKSIEEGASSPPSNHSEKRYEVILDFGKPSSEKVETLGEVAALLKVGYDLFQAEGTGDVQVFDRGFDVTDSQVIQEMIGEIMEAGEPLLSPIENESEDHNIHVEEAMLEAMEEEPETSKREEGCIEDCGRCFFSTPEGGACEYEGKDIQAAIDSVKPKEPTKEELIALYKKRPEICKARAEAMGLEACLDCPVRCNVSDDNYNQLINIVEANPDAFPDRKSGVQERCTYGDAPADGKCSACGKPLCGACGYKLGDDKLCNSCWELDPR